MLYTWKSIESCYSGVFNQPSWPKKLFIIIFKMTRNDIIQRFYHNYVDYTGICPRSVTISWSGHFDRSCYCQSIGITFSKSGSFNAAKKDLVNIFDKTVKPILLYGCETWGFGKNDIIEKVHLKFCKLLLHVKTSTPNVMVYGELGRYPIDIDIKSSYDFILVKTHFRKSGKNFIIIIQTIVYKRFSK